MTVFKVKPEKAKWEPSVAREFVAKVRATGKTVTELGFSLYEWKEFQRHCKSDLVPNTDRFQGMMGVVGTWEGLKIRADSKLLLGTMSAADDEKYVAHRWRDTDVHDGDVEDCMDPDCAIHMIMGAD